MERMWGNRYFLFQFTRLGGLETSLWFPEGSATGPVCGLSLAPRLHPFPWESANQWRGCDRCTGERTWGPLRRMGRGAGLALGLWVPMVLVGRSWSEPEAASRKRLILMSLVITCPSRSLLPSTRLRSYRGSCLSILVSFGREIGLQR